MDKIANVIKITTPTRIDLMSEESYLIFKGDIDNFELICTVDIEEPLPNAKDRGVYKVVFLDKHLLKDKNIQWLAM